MSDAVGDHTRVVCRPTPKAGGIMNFAVKKETCMSCKTVLTATNTSTRHLPFLSVVLCCDCDCDDHRYGCMIWYLPCTVLCGLVLISLYGLWLRQCIVIPIFHFRFAIEHKLW